MHDLNRLACRVLSGCCFLAVTALTTHAQPLTFTTLAGTPGGAGSEDGTGSDARFGFLTGLSTDSAGNVYMADISNATIRKISPAGVMTTLAGLAGVSASRDGTGGDARFRSPQGLATDSAGNVYVTEPFRVRKITPAGVVTTLAGVIPWDYSGSEDGTGSAARFNGLSGVAADSAGNVYVADSWNHTIRKITPAGVVTTLAGMAGVSGSDDGTGSAARFDYPGALATDRAGNVYVTDKYTIRKITPAGVVTTLAGTAGVGGSADGTGRDARFSSLMGMATDSGGNVYVADFSTIRKITPAGVVTTFVGSAGSFGSADETGSAARFDYPSALATDIAGNVYVADRNNHTIRKVTPAGVVTTFAGTRMDGSDDGTGSAARFNHPSGVAADSAGNVYVADSYNFTVRKITPAGVVTTLAGSAGQWGFADGTGNAARFSLPYGVATDNAGNVYVADYCAVRKITPAGVVTTLAGSAGQCGSADGTGGAARFNGPTGVATDSGGNIYVADTDNDTIRKITPAGVVSTLAGSPGLHGASDGTGSTARFYRPFGVAADGGGNVYVADGWNGTVRKITPAGVVTTLAGSAGQWGSDDGTGSAARFRGPNGVATDGGGNVYVFEDPGITVRKITPAGVVTTVARGYENNVSHEGLFGIAAGSAGSIYVTDMDEYKIRVGRPTLPDIAAIDFPTGAVSTTRQLSTSPQTATSWQWRIIRQPSGSTATLSSTSIRNPVFMPDVADLYTFQLTASDGVRTSITTVNLTATPPLPPRHRAARH